MKKIEKKHRKVIETQSGIEYERLFAEAMDELANYSPIVIDKLNHEGHCSYIEWTEVMEVPEDIRDEYHQRGEFFKCGQCPFFEQNPDGRIKYFRCEKVGHRVYKPDCACLYLYQRVAEGEIKID